MTGPVQVLVVGFDEPTYSGEVLAELTRLEAAGIVRLVDLLVVARTAGGELEIVADERLPAGSGELAVEVLTRAESEPAPADEDTATWSLADAVPAGGTAAVALVEHVWASPLRDAIRRSGGRALDETWLAPDDVALLERLERDRS